jgi:hypothetical protein
MVAAMKGTDRVEAQESRETRPTVARSAASGGPARQLGPSPAQALALQRAAGNRATGKMLARWIKHPDKDKKGVMVPDSSAAEYDHFNPPKNA